MRPTDLPFDHRSHESQRKRAFFHRHPRCFAASFHAMHERHCLKRSGCCRSGLAASLAGFIALAITSNAERFPFVIPGDDATPTVTDLSHLSAKPAGADGFVRIRDGKFYTDSGRLKIWGVNTCFAANFPTRAEAEKVAAHLAKLGVNGVRMHHHDNGSAPRGVWRSGNETPRTLDPAQLDRQDYFLDQLHRHGIYANLNLHVSRTFTAAEGFITEDLPRAVRYDKYLLYFEPRMRALFKEFCRDYLTHTNTCRKLRRVDDPGIAMIEITNENAFSTVGADLAAQLPERYRNEFQRQWNRWLARRYSSTGDLKRAWGVANEPLGSPLNAVAAWATNLGGWRLNQSATHPVVARFNQPGPQLDLKALRLEIQRAAPQTHLHELQLPSLPLEAGRVYTLSFWIRADTNRPVYVDVSNQGPDNWRDVGLAESVTATPRWERVVRVFRASDTIAGRVRICFKFGGNATSFALADVSLRPGGEFIVLPPGQSLEQGNVGIPVKGWSDAARREVFQFMADTEKEFIREIMQFLKQDLGVRVPITASQITYHGAEIVAETCDYADIHAYWQHPVFPNRPWDPVDWTLGNTPMERVPGADSLLSRAPWRLLDRPFTLSEWNIPAPHDYAASTVPFAALIAALQDWDGVFFFDYHSSDRGWFDDAIRGFFSFNGHPVKLALLTACAHLYRRGDLPPLRDTAAGTLNACPPAALGLSHRLGIQPDNRQPTAFQVANPKRLASPEDSVIWDATDAHRAHVQINTPATRAVWGLIAGQRFDLGGVKISVGTVDRDYAVLVLTSLDGQPLETARRILLTAVGSAENEGMVWNEARKSVGNKWGRGPTQVNGIAAEITLPFRVDSLHALDGRGQRQATVPVQSDGSGSRFSIGPAQQTLWCEIVAGQ